MTTTTNYLLTKPTVGGDADAWGGYLNTDMDTIDASLSGIAASLINGLTLSAAGSTATFGIAAGNAGDSSGRLMTLASAYTKTTSSWAVGSGTGALDTGAIANSTWYHVYIIKRVDTGVVDILVSLSASAPTMPTNYTLKRRIGAMKTDGSAQWIKFSQLNDDFLWDVPVQDISNVTPGATTAFSVTLTVPTGIKVGAVFSCTLSDSANVGINFSSLDVSDQAAAGTGVVTLLGSTAIAGVIQGLRTNTSAQVRARVTTVTAVYWVSTRGWIDPRGKF